MLDAQDSSISFHNTPSYPFLPRLYDAVLNRPTSFSVFWNGRSFDRSEIVLYRSYTLLATRSTFQRGDRWRSDEAAAMKSPMDATPREGATNGCGMSLPQVASPQRSSMEPKTPAQIPLGSRRISGLRDADAAAIGCPSAAHRWLPRVPAGATTLFRDSDRSEWGLSEESAPVMRQLADQFQDEEVLLWEILALVRGCHGH